MNLKVLTSDYIYDNISSDGSTFYTKDIKIYAGNQDESDNSISEHIDKQKIECDVTVNWITAIFQQADITNTYKGIQITVQENTGTSDRTGRIYLKYDEYKTPNCIQINQKGKSVTEITIEFDVQAYNVWNGYTGPAGGIDGFTFFGTEIKNLTSGIDFPSDIEVNDKAGTVYFNLHTQSYDYLYSYVYVNNKNRGVVPNNINGLGDKNSYTYNSSNPLRYVKFDEQNTTIKTFPENHDPSDKIYAYINGVSFDVNNETYIYVSRSSFELNTSNVQKVEALILKWE